MCPFLYNSASTSVFPVQLKQQHEQLLQFIAEVELQLHHHYIWFEYLKKKKRKRKKKKQNNKKEKKKKKTVGNL